MSRYDVHFGVRIQHFLAKIMYFDFLRFDFSCKISVMYRYYLKKKDSFLTLNSYQNTLYRYFHHTITLLHTFLSSFFKEYKTGMEMKNNVTVVSLEVI